MAYITYQQYVDLYGDTVAESDFGMYAEQAAIVIDIITQNRIVSVGFGNLSLHEQQLVRRACAAQIMYFAQMGLETVLGGQVGQSFTVGKVSVSGSAQGKAEALMVSPLAAAILEQTPLMERGALVC